MIEPAIELASLGWRVFPLQARSKLPATAHGCKDATDEPNALRAMWGPVAGVPNVGLATGCDSDVWVLDVDGDPGAATLATLTAKHGPLPETVEATTGRGRHVYFRHPGAAVALRNSAGKVGKGLDVRADGGYVVCPPSIHPSGEPYRWVRAPDAIPLASAPDWLLALAVDKPRPAPEPASYVPAERIGGATRYGQAALDAECRDLAAAPEGGRNDRLNGVAFRVGQLVRSGHLDESSARREVLAAAKACGLEERESEKTFASGLAGGWQKPNHNDPDPNAPRAREHLRVVPPPADGDTPTEAAGEPGPRAQAAAARSAAPAIVILSTQEVAQIALDYLQNTETRKRLPRFGFPILDTAIGGQPPGTMVVIGGSTGSGKSGVALEIALAQACRQSITVGYVSCEDAEWVVGSRVLASVDDVNPEQFFKADVDAVTLERARRGVQSAESIGVKHSYQIGKRIEDVLRAVKGLVACGCRHIIIDYLQAISARGEDRYHARTDHTQMLKGYCHDAGIPLTLLSQFKRHTGEPTMSDLKDSGDIENMADAVILLWKESDEEHAPTFGKVSKVKWSPRRPRFMVERKHTGAVIGLVHRDTPPAPENGWNDKGRRRA